MKKNACATVVKNGGRRLAEWIAFHLAIGFDTIIVLDNGSTDETRAIAEAFQSHYDVRIADWVRTDPDYQKAGFDHILTQAKSEFEWVACIDCDEFITLPEGRHLSDLFKLPSHVGGIALPWAIFGSNGHDTTPQDLIIRSYVRRSEEKFGPNKLFKSVIRPIHFISCLNSHFYSLTGIYVDMMHNPIEVKSGRRDNPPDYAAGQLNHYFVQSKEDWANKIKRGYHDCKRDFDEFYAYDRNEIFDTLAARYGDNVDYILNHVYPNPL